jgi:hypothetical protein
LLSVNGGSAADKSALKLTSTAATMPIALTKLDANP